MNLALYIARRYLFAKKTHHAVNIISTISVCGIAVATIAMICILSVLNGFKGQTSLLFSLFDPDLKIAAVESKVFDPTTNAMVKVCALPEIQQYCGVLQETALIRYGERQDISILKGVDSTFRHLALIDSAIIDGKFILAENDFNYALLGRGLAFTLGVNAAFAFPAEIYLPDRLSVYNPANPMSYASNEYVYIGGIYQVDQPVYDEGFMLVSIDLMRKMLDYEKEVSALEIKLVLGSDVASVQKKIRQLLGDGFTVKDRYEQQEALFKIIQVEKWVSFLMLCFILALALFNVLSSLAILMIEKKDDVEKLRSMGADNRLINRIFLFEGWMISVLGALIGVVIGIGLCLLQQYAGLIKLGEAPGMFIMDAYPVKVEWPDVLIVFITVILLGFLAVLYPVHYLGKKRLLKELAVCLALSFLFVNCGGQRKESVGGQKKEIAVSIDPFCYFGRKIAGDDYAFFAIVPAGRGPETYDPSLSEMMKVGKSEAFFYINRLSLEQAIIKSLHANNPDTYMFDISESLDKDIDDLCEDHDLHDSQSHSHRHSHDPHIWTSFTGAKVMSKNIYRALSVMNHSKSDYYLSNYQRLMSELEQLECELHRQLDTLSCRGFAIFHPALTYFAKEFNLIQYSIEEDGKDPSPATLKRLIDDIRSAQIKVIFVQLEFDRNYAEQIAKETGARIVMINPLDQQWDIQMKRIAKALVADGKVD